MRDPWFGERFSLRRVPTAPLSAPHAEHACLAIALSSARVPLWCRPTRGMVVRPALAAN